MGLASPELIELFSSSLPSHYSNLYTNFGFYLYVSLYKTFFAPSKKTDLDIEGSLTRKSQ